MKKILGIAAVLLASACAVFAGGAGEAAPADPNVRNVEFWHTMTGVNASAIDALVDEFNNTIGKEEGIHVESIFQGNDNSEKLKTLAQAGDMKNFPDGVVYGPIMAASMLVLLPTLLVFLIFQKRIVGGIMGGSVKG